MIPHFVWLQDTQVDQLRRFGVVGGQQLQLATTPVVSSAVADMRDVGAIADQRDTGQGRPHRAIFGVVVSEVVHAQVGSLDGATQGRLDAGVAGR